MAGFDVLKKIAEGRAAEAFLVRQQGSTERVVLEILKPELPEEFRRRFVQEASALQARSHPQLVPRAHLGETADGRPFTVSAPLEGETLTATLWSMGLLDSQDVIQLAIPLCAALEYVHQSGTAHGGLSAENVYLAGGLAAYCPKLIDLRLAFRWGTGDRNASGRLDYFAPERLAGQAVDARADIYAMGILLYEALTGFPPFTAASAQQMLEKQRRGVPALPASCETLAAIVQRCLQLSPADRYATARELSDELARELEIATTPPGGLGRPRGTVNGAARALEAEAPVSPPTDASRRSALPRRRSSAHSAGRAVRRWSRRRAASFVALALAVLSAVGAGWLSRKKPIIRSYAAPTLRARASVPARQETLAAEPPPKESEPSPPDDAVRLRVTSEPPGALVVWARSGEALGRTPLIASLPRQPDESTVRIELPGYRAVSRKIKLDSDATAHAKLKSAAVPSRKKIARRRHRSS